MNNHYQKTKKPNIYWRDHAACKGMDLGLFFPERGEPYSVIRQTKKICFGCPVMLECLEMILNTENDNFGIFGGTTPKERRKIRSERTYGYPDFLPPSLLSDHESAKALAVGGETKERVA